MHGTVKARRNSPCVPGFSPRLLTVLFCAMLPMLVPVALFVQGPFASAAPRLLAFAAAALLGAGLAWVCARALLPGVIGEPQAAPAAEDDVNCARREQQLLRSHGQLRALAARMESAREDERRRIAREVHDQLGQALTGLRFDIAWLQARVAEQPALCKKTGEMSGLVDEMVQAVRRIAMALRPVVLDDLGFIPAVEWQIQEFEARTHIRCEFRTSLAGVDLEPPKAITLFRILQEALTNVARHAGASRVLVRLTREDDTLVFSVNDDGAGFDPQRVEVRHSLGLLGMRERASLVGGSVSVAGRPGKGTEVTVRVPLFVDGPLGLWPSREGEGRDP
jgi:signal transduction histidine kinase